MKQLLITQGRTIVVDVPAPVVKKGHVLVEVAYSLISTGTEISAISSSGKSILQRGVEKPDRVKKVFDNLRSQGLQNTIAKVKDNIGEYQPTGYSCSGVVIDIGDDIDEIPLGTLVACAGAGIANHAEIVLVPKNLMVKVPEGCTLKSAASVTLGAIAMQGVRRVDPRLGEVIAVIGLGLLGQITVQLLKAAGLNVVGFDLDSNRVKVATKLGADWGFENVGVDAVREISYLSNGYGVDSTIITASSQSSSIVQQAMEITRKKGKVVVVGAVGLNLNRSPFYEKEIDFLISTSYGPGRYDEQYEIRGEDYPYAYVRWTENRNMAEYLNLLRDGKVILESILEEEYSISDAPEAYKQLQTGKDKPLGVLLNYGTVESVQVSKKINTKVQVKNNYGRIDGKINLAVIGAGNFAKGMHLPNLRNLSDQYHIGAIVSSTGINAKRTAEQVGADYASTNYEDVLEDSSINAVLISTRHNLHSEQIIQALNAGKHVYCEKPLALDEEELNEILTVLDYSLDEFKSGKQPQFSSNHTPVLMVGFNRRFSNFATDARKIIYKRKEPLIINYRVNAGFIPLNNWVHTYEGGGRIVGEACHMFDLFQYFVNPARPTNLTTARIKPKSEIISATDNIVSVVSYDDGSICNLIYTALGSRDFGKERIEIFSDERCIVIDDFSKISYYGINKRSRTSKKTDKGHLQALDTFGKIVKGDNPWAISLEELVNTTLLSIQASHT